MTSSDVKTMKNKVKERMFSIPGKLARKIEKQFKKKKIVQDKALKALLHAKFDNAENFAKSVLTLGDQLNQQGFSELADECYDLCLDAEPNYFLAYLRKGMIAFNSRRYQEAYTHLKNYLSFDGSDIDAVKLSCELAVNLEQKDEAWQLLNHLVQLDPNCAWAFQQLGILCFENGQTEHSEQLFARAIQLGMDSAKLMNDYGAALEANEKHREAIIAFKRALEIQPNTVVYLNNLVHAYADLNEFEEAEHYAKLALKYGEDDGVAHYNFGMLLERQSKFAEVVKHYERALELDKELSHIYCNLCHAYHLLGRYADAEVVGEAGFKKHPDYEKIAVNLAFCCFAQDKWEKGIEYYGNRKVKNRIVDVPAWQGEDLTGKKLMIWTEQGIGDQMLFCWYLPLLKEENVTVVLEVDRRLVDLVQRSYPWLRVVGEDTLTVPEVKQENFDFMTIQASLLNRYWKKVRRAREVYFDNLGKDIVFGPCQFTVNEETKKHWQNKLTQLSKRPKIGICWRSGMSSVSRDRHYLDAKHVIDLFNELDVDVVNLQYGATDDELVCLSSDKNLSFVDPDFDLKNDQDDLASLISNLDLVISAATAVASLSAMLGKPTWVFGRCFCAESTIIRGLPFVGMIPSTKYIFVENKPIDAVLEPVREKLTFYLNDLNKT